MFCCLLVPGLLLLFVLFDVFYFLRIVLTVLFGRLFQKRGKVTDPTTIYGLCFTQDLDLVLKHMNNARFVRDLDFARFHFFDRSGLYSQMVKHRTDALQAATNIRYRRVIPFLSFYKVVTKMVWWDEKSVYLEQRFVTGDGFVRAVVLSKQTLLKPVVEEAVGVLGAGPRPPSPPEDLRLWLQSMEASSAALRPPKSD